MPRFTTILATAIAGLALAASATQAGAETVMLKTKIVRMPASALKTPDSRICMPRETSPIVGKDKSMPKTLCQTVAQWSEHGVSIIAR
ncbi:hypothetical protein [uncultured Sphingomonas sp.]|uniref:hypothetical protein n=1 Tax=uncultured Sphingomonas sp. TaxID=158754 RepID=UPI0026357F51|nr:hypothetical protein [uncultured Sphingomonas sp.]